MAQSFFYSKQIRRFLLQIQRVFSNFQVEYGKDETGVQRLQTVPVRYGDASRIVGQIMRENSENKIVPTPMIGFYITGFDYDRDRVQQPHHVDKIHVRQRDLNENTGELDTSQGNAFTVERLMPVPHKLTINVDIWTSNTEQKFQLIEQIAWIFNPALEIQSTDNFLDWTSLTRMERTSLNWSSKSVPAGVDEQTDIATLTFELPIWITPPAKVKKLGVIRAIVASVFDETGSIDDNVIDNDLVLGTRIKTTWMGYGILVINGEVQILKNNETSTNVDNEFAVPAKVGTDDVTWRAFLEAYGDFQNGISQLRLTQDDESEVIGTISYHPSDDYKLLFNVDTDTIPTNNLTAITAIIDPSQSGPGTGLIAAVLGQRYLITQDIGNAVNFDGADAWKGLGYSLDTSAGDVIAYANDIIEYDGDRWIVSFDSSAVTTTNYVTNTTTNIQYTWNGSSWLKSWQGPYPEGEWRIII